jgi:hypothetical protein
VARQEGGQCSIGFVKAWMARFSFWRRGRRSPEPPSEPAEDPRAEELRRKLEESRTIAEEQHEQAAEPETPVDQAPEPDSVPEPPADPTVEERRAAVHERARAAADEMRGE